MSSTPSTPAPSRSAVDDRSHGRTPVVAEQRRPQRSVVDPPGHRFEVGERVQIDAAQRLHERPHVRQLVLAGAVDQRRHEVRQHRRRPIPAEHVEQLERLLGVDRPVPVRQVVIADDRGEPRAEVGRVVATLDGGEDQALGPPDLLGLDSDPEGGRRRVGLVTRCRQGVDRSVPLGLGDPGDPLDDRQGALVPLVQVDHRQTVGGRGDGMAPAELRSRRAVGDRLPDEFTGVLARLQEPHDVARHLAGVVALDAAAQADPRPLAHDRGVGSVDRHPHVTDRDRRRRRGRSRPPRPARTNRR